MVGVVGVLWVVGVYVDGLLYAFGSRCSRRGVVVYVAKH